MPGSWTRIRRSSRSRKIRKAGRELLTEEVTSDPGRATAALAFTVNVADPELDFGSMEPREVREEVHAGWRSFFSALAAETPVVVIVEDIHWADAALLDLLDESSERVVGPVLFVCPSRPHLAATRPAWGGGRRNHSSIALDPLTPEEADRLVHELLTIEDLPPSVHTRILERAEGNPFFLEEIVRQLVDEGHLVREGDRWRALDKIEQVVIPDTVQAVLAARFDLLDAQDKRVLQAAAVVGRVFWPGPVALLAHRHDEAVDASLRILEERELILSRMTSSLAGQQELIFKHVLIRDVAYESLPRRDRTDAHAAVAGWIEETAGDRAGEMSELLAYHLSTAVALSRDTPSGPTEELQVAAFRWLLRASDEARRRLVVGKAQRLAEEALDLASGDLERTDALEILAQAFFVDYLGDLAWRYFREAAFTRARVETPRRNAGGASRSARLRRRRAVAGVDARRGPRRKDSSRTVGSRDGTYAARRHEGADLAARDQSRVAVRVLPRPLFRGRARGALSLGPGGSGDSHADGSA
jgi:hypothetical protein